MKGDTPLKSPPHHLDFVMDDSADVISTGPDAAEWLAQPSALTQLREALGDVKAQSPSGWWAAVPPVNVRFVPMQSKEGARVLVTVVPTRPELLEAFELLTPTQRTIAEFAGAGATNAEIARAIDRSPETVRTHIKEIYRRLSICTRLELQWLLRRPAISYGT